MEVAGLQVMQNGVETGQGRPLLVLLHDAGEGAWAWQGWLDELAAGGWPAWAPTWQAPPKESLPPDAMEHAPATLEPVLAQLRALLGAAPGPVALIGQGLGGLLALTLAREGKANPLHALVLLSPTPPEGVPIDLPEAPPRPQGAPHPEAAERAVRRFHALPPEAGAALVARMERLTHAMHRVVSGKNRVALDLSAPPCPTLIFQAEFDHVVGQAPWALAERMGAERRRIWERGHALHLDAEWEGVCNLASGWLAEHTSTPAESAKVATATDGVHLERPDATPGPPFPFAGGPPPSADLWDDTAAARVVAEYAAKGVSEDLALRVHTSRLIGGDDALVLHGGGNTSVKSTALDTLGQPVEVLYVKGSGWDLATIEPQGFPAVRLEPLRALRSVDAMSDEAMVNALRINLLDASAPNPSVEALLHAFLPHRFVDHTHADAILALVDQPEPEALCREVFGDKLAFLPFVFPGFPLAGQVMEVVEQNPQAEGIVLGNHGLFTWGDTAKESYQRMIHYVGIARAALDNAAHERGGRVFFPQAPVPTHSHAEIAEAANMLRGALARPVEGAGGTPQAGTWRRWLLHRRQTPAIDALIGGMEAHDYTRRGVATPDHIIRTKNLPLLLPSYDPAHGAEWAQRCREAVEGYCQEYAAYFADGVAHTGQEKTMLDPLPRVLLVPGMGAFCAGKTLKEAAIAGDIYEHTAWVIAHAEALGTYTPLPARELFAMEYWSLEQAKLGKGAEPPLARQVALVTGAASGIGAATAAALGGAGAHIALLDRDAEGLKTLAAELKRKGISAVPLEADVTDPAAVARAFRMTALLYGGVDLVVSNAGAVWQGDMGAVDDGDLRDSFELNFFSHQYVAREAIAQFQRQGTGGQLLFNASKSAFNPGPKLGPYTVPKAALVALMKQYAVDYAAQGIRCNAINADRVPTGLFGEGVLEARAQARGLSVEAYLSGNMLGLLVRAEDVARAFLALALSERTTGAVLPVDGGNIAAAPR